MSKESINDPFFEKIKEAYYIYRKFTINLFEYLTKSECKYKESCYRKNKFDVDYYLQLKKLKNLQIKSAFNFTELVFSYLKKNYDANSNEVLNFFQIIKEKSLKNNDLNDIFKKNEFLPDSPNFAILISITLNYEKLKKFGNENLEKFLSLMEQEGITGTYELNINDKFKNQEFYDFKTIYKRTYYLLNKQGVYGADARFNNISNTIITSYLTLLNKDEQKEEQKDEHESRSRSAVRSTIRSRSRSRSKSSRSKSSRNQSMRRSRSTIRGGIKNKNIKVPVKYLPTHLSKKDKKKQKKMLHKSRKLYKKGIYLTRKKVKSFKSKKSQHVKNAEKLFNVKNLSIDNKLAKATGCSKKGLKLIVKKGEGAYYSSGSRPNQTASSWGYARLGSAITGSKAALYDFKIIKKYCNKNSKTLKLAKKSFKKFKNSKIKKVDI